MINRKTGDYLFLPNPASPMNQPAYTIQVLDYMRELWLKKLIEEQEKQ